MSWTKKYRNAAPTTIRNVLPITRGAGETSELGAEDGSIGKDDSTKSPLAVCGTATSAL
jgi:hypothetical protein